MQSSSLESSLIISTTPISSAQSLAHFLIQNRYAACVNIVPKITSIYLWKDEVCEDQEALLLIKTSQQRVGECIEALKDQHPYDVPEMISFPIDTQNSLTAYLQWIQTTTSPSS